LREVRNALNHLVFFQNHGRLEMHFRTLIFAQIGVMLEMHLGTLTFHSFELC